jgi:hypothetical protein
MGLLAATIVRKLGLHIQRAYLGLKPGNVYRRERGADSECYKQVLTKPATTLQLKAVRSDRSIASEEKETHGYRRGRGDAGRMGLRPTATKGQRLAFVSQRDPRIRTVGVNSSEGAADPGDQVPRPRRAAAQRRSHC